jgi:CDP-6-deoxy-D-xylo-4-hexulose-3-dehydrase
MAPTSEQILKLVADYARERHATPAFDSLAPSVPVSGKVFGAEEAVALVRTSLDFWLTAGPETAQFESSLARKVGLRHALMVNSGSSANLAAISALTSARIGENRLRPGDEVITVAAAFPTTVNPIIQSGLVPVLVEVSLPTYNVDVRHLEVAVSGRTRAVVLAHKLKEHLDYAVQRVSGFHHKLSLRAA